MKLYKYPAKNNWAAITERPLLDSSLLEKKVKQILLTIRKKGDKAVFKYAKKFDPFGTPTDLNNEFLYPVVNASHEDERGRNEMIDLQVSVRHRPSAPSDLILHSEHGFELMQEISATAGLEIERLPGRFPSGN